MSTPSIVERAAQIIEQHPGIPRGGDAPLRCTCGWVDWSAKHSKHVAALLAQAGLLADGAPSAAEGKKKREPLGPIVRFLNWVAWPRRDQP